MPEIDARDRNYILNIIDAIEKIQDYTLPFLSGEDFINDSKTFDATMMNFIVIGEMALKISDKL